MDTLHDRLRLLLGIEVEELRGARVAGELPLTDDVVNRVIAARLAAAKTPISAARVSAREGNVIDVHLVPAARFLPSITVEVRIERQPEFPDRPVLRMRWSMPGTGPLARLATPFLANLESLPPGIRIDADLVTIDVREILVAHGFGDVIEFVSGLRIDTRPGVFVLKFDLGVGAGV
jgi:hypothetical protein